MISLTNINKSYRTATVETLALNNINLKVDKGEFISIMGPSGCGKSTLLNIMGLLDAPTKGEIKVCDQEIKNFPDNKLAHFRNQKLGFIFQSYHLIDELTVYENIEMPLLYKNVKSAERKSMVCDILDRFQIVGKKDLFPSQLSGGQQQLVGIARAVICNPKLILADEPTGNLNSKQGEEIMTLFTKLNQEGTTIIQVTHSEKNSAYGRRVINLLDGRIA